MQLDIAVRALEKIAAYSDAVHNAPRIAKKALAEIDAQASIVAPAAPNPLTGPLIGEAARTVDQDAIAGDAALEDAAIYFESLQNEHGQQVAKELRSLKCCA